MEIKFKGTEKAGVLVYDLSDVYSKEEMSKASRVNAISSALTEYFNTLRGIRKYNSVLEINGIELTPKLKKQILDTEAYYRTLLYNILQEFNVDDFLS